LVNSILDQSIGLDPGLVSVLFSLVSISAPIPGAATGGYLADLNVYLISKC
jgi:hypothetical protein